MSNKFSRDITNIIQTYDLPRSVAEDIIKGQKVFESKEFLEIKRGLTGGCIPEPTVLNIIKTISSNPSV